MPMIELNPHEFDSVTTAVEPLHYHLWVRAIIDGYIPGRIWAADTTTALIWDTRYTYYLSGVEDNHEFNAALDGLIFDTIAPEAIKKGIRMYFVICPPNWEKKILNNEVLVDRFPKRIKRCYYMLDKKVEVNWKDKIPAGYTMESVDKNLLDRIDLENIDILCEEIDDIITSVDEFIRKEFVGYCLVYKDKEIVSWSLSFMYGSSHEFTVQTVEEYQQRGFGTLTTAALIDYCLFHNAASIGWHCGQENVPSIKLAEKVGFKRTKHDYSWLYGDLTD
jgi:RimJ/RimL family protein N-acetyltransferase